MNSKEWLAAIAKVAVSDNPKKTVLGLILAKAVEDSAETKEVVEYINDVIQPKNLMDEYVEEMTIEELYLWIESSGDEWLMEVLGQEEPQHD